MKRMTDSGGRGTACEGNRAARRAAVQHRALRKCGASNGTADSGFSLLEVMFALVFLGIGLLAVAGMIPLATHQIVSAKQVTDATAAGQTQMEQIRTTDFGSLTAGTYTATSGVYSLTWTITDNTPVTGSKRVDMTVTWTTSAGTQTTNLKTYVTR